MSHADLAGPISGSRRGFLRSVVGAGLVVSFHIPFARDAAAQADLPPEVNAWVEVWPDDSIVIRIARSEMGQGTLTGLAQLVAEELDADWGRVTTAYPTPGASVARKRAWGNFSTGGSAGIRGSQAFVRRGGAGARMLLVQAAAEEWKVRVEECRTADSIITHVPSGRTVSYGKVAAAAGKLPPPTEIKLRDPKDWKLAGKRLARLDTVAKTTGAQVYGMDLKLPGMLNAAIKQCPVFGGRIKSFNAAAIERHPGVKKVMPVGDSAVAVVADTWWRANSALEALPVEWDKGPNAKLSSADIAAKIKDGLAAGDAAVGNLVGDAKAAIAGSARKIEAVYSFPYQNHATMEAMNATVKWTAQRCEVWAPTQNGEAALMAAAEAAGLPQEQCEVYKVHLGGGFGRRGVHDWLRQAVLIAKEMPGVPIKLLWTREEDMLHGCYHPATQCKLSAGLDAGGEIAGLHMRICGQPVTSAQVFQPLSNGRDTVVFQGLNAPGPEASIGYTLSHLLVDHAPRSSPVPTGQWRGVNLNHNTLYLECFIDEIANATGQDPLALRRKLMAAHPKHLAVLNAVAERVGWGQPAASGVFRGLAQAMGMGSFVAACAEVSVGKVGKVKVHRIVAAIDPGYAVNPQQIEAQVEGSFAYGLSATFFGECTLKDGQMEQDNFSTYRVLKMGEMPQVETIVMPSGGFWGGVGEPAIGVGAPAVLNAIFAATGKRIRDLPIKNHSLEKV